MQLEKSSFRDPSGYVFYYNNAVYRTIENIYAPHYTCLMTSGLYLSLTEQRLLIPHKEIDIEISPPIKPYKIIAPENISCISYPYEWCFEQLKEAAVITLKCQLESLEHGMTLKDASSYNIQFYKGQAIFIDTLSFEKHTEGMAWKAYGQFCRHFLAPLLLMKYVSLDANALLKNYLDGIPLDFTSNLLPLKTKFNLSILSHIHWHASSQKRYQNIEKKIKHRALPTKHLKLFIRSLLNVVNSLSINNANESTWSNYYMDTNYTDISLESKKTIIERWGTSVNPKKVCDWGANNGYFSRIFSEKGIETIAIDNDPIAVNNNYTQVKESKNNYLLPLWADITNPSPAIGWATEERSTLLSRTKADLSMALALIHHLHITHHICFEQMAYLFQRQTQYLIIEFIPKTDTQVQKLLLNRPDIFDTYDIFHFEKAFKHFFELIDKENIYDSERILYFFKKKT